MGTLGNILLFLALISCLMALLTMLYKFFHVRKTKLLERRIEDGDLETLVWLDPKTAQETLGISEEYEAGYPEMLVWLDRELTQRGLDGPQLEISQKYDSFNREVMYKRHVRDLQLPFFALLLLLVSLLFVSLARMCWNIAVL